jgi:hypothetical protein
MQPESRCLFGACSLPNKYLFANGCYQTNICLPNMTLIFPNTTLFFPPLSSLLPTFVTAATLPHHHYLSSPPTMG